MLNLSPLDSFSIKLKSSLTDLILVLTQPKKKKKKNNEEHRRSKNPENPKIMTNELLQQTHFQKILFSNNQTQQPISKNSSSSTIKHSNQRVTTKSTNPSKPKTHLGFCSDWISDLGFVGVAGIGLKLWGRFCWSWSDRIGDSLSLCLVSYLSFPTEAYLGFAWIGSELGF